MSRNVRDAVILLSLGAITLVLASGVYFYSQKEREDYEPANHLLSSPTVLDVDPYTGRRHTVLIPRAEATCAPHEPYGNSIAWWLAGIGALLVGGGLMSLRGNYRLSPDTVPQDFD